MNERIEELTALREEVRALVKRWKNADRFEPRPDAWGRGYDRDFSREMGKAGFIGITWPDRFGGAARTNLHRLAITEELLRSGAPVAAHWIADRQIGPAILRYGTPQLQAEFLPRIAAGELTFCLGMSETEAGSDLAAVRTTATPTDDGWVISGSKVWTTQAHRSEYAYVLARTDGSGDKHEGLTEFIVDMNAEGVETRPIIDLQGEHHFNEVHFADVHIPAHYIIGEAGNGWKQVTDQLAFERGGAERILSTYIVLERLLSALNCSDDTAALEGLAGLVAEVTALRRMVWEIAIVMDRGQAPVVEAAMLKFLGTRYEETLAKTARYIMEEAPRPPSAELSGMIGDALMAAPGGLIRGGSAGVMLGIIARAEVKR